MMKKIFIFLFIISILVCAESAKQNSCPSIQCGDSAIYFPFRLESQPQVCGCQGFELSCQGNKTIIKLPYSEDSHFVVDSIDYEAQQLRLTSSDIGCPPRSFLKFDLSTSPFYLFDPFPYNYNTIFNCSSNISISSYTVRQVSCLRDLPGHFYIAASGFDLGSCTSISPYYDILVLQWDYFAYCRDCSNGNDTKCVIIPSSSYAPDTLKVTGSNAKKVIIIGICSVAFLVTVAAVVLLMFQLFRAKRRKEQEIKIERFWEEYKALKPTRYSYAQIKKMTDNFRRKLGEGGYGSVFKGKLPNGVPIAVKLLDDPTVNGDEFINEVGTIGRIHHINIVRLFGYCVEGLKRALIYEFMPNESLEKFIFVQDDGRVVFSWAKLQEIAMGIARGIEYLHQGCDYRILHFDIKPHNILLDRKFAPKISDFGLAKLCSKEMSIVSMTAVRGTVGYIAPEVYLRNTKMVSHKSDVYSFGMLLLEMVGGRKNDDGAAGDATQIYFPEWIYSRVVTGEELGLRTEREEDAEIAKRLTVTALWCIQWNPNDRPSMRVALQMLEGSMESLSLPPNPFTSAEIAN